MSDGTLFACAVSSAMGKGLSEFPEFSFLGVFRWEWC